MTQTENLTKAISSLEYRIAALAVRFTNAKSDAIGGDNPRDISRKINEYGRTLSILTKQLEIQQEKDSIVAKENKEKELVDDMLEAAWGLIANAGWDAHRADTTLDKSPGWHEAAIKFRDKYFVYISNNMPTVSFDPAGKADIYIAKLDTPLPTWQALGNKISREAENRDKRSVNSWPEVS
jgi:hypothetical protein